jgi:sialic acid synthase SpsE
VAKVRSCWEAIGTAPAMHREPRDLSARKGLVARRAIAAGEPLSWGNTRFSWPPIGISIEHWDLVEGRKTARGLAAQEPLRWADIDFA